ncbi:MAG: N-acetyltransferase [Pseudomonadota bacterium]
MGWSLVAAVDRDLDELMAWLPDRAAVDVWGGPIFRFPFTRETFLQDCHWDEFATYRLNDGYGNFAAFGQIGERYGRSHLARLIASPTMRGQGVGSRLMTHLMQEARRLYRYEECGLFVYRHNAPALHCYKAAGFEIVDYPDDAPMPDECFYLKRKL